MTSKPITLSEAHELAINVQRETDARLEADRTREAVRDIAELIFCETCSEDCEKLAVNNAYPPRYCHGCYHKLAAELTLARKVADAAAHRQITLHAYHRVRLLKPVDYDARIVLVNAGDEAYLALQEAVREYRDHLEAAGVMARPGVRRGLEGCDKLEVAESK